MTQRLPTRTEAVVLGFAKERHLLMCDLRSLSERNRKLSRRLKNLLLWLYLSLVLNLCALGGLLVERLF